jgi:dimeric dUTPase (all-alpha-NTP-PPase superfamily)
MADETETSTPVETSDVTTSTDTPEVSETAEVEVTDDTQTAETETGTQDEGGTAPETEKLYAGKYKSIEELEKGYQEAQKTLTQNLQIKAKYDELLKKQEQQEARLLQKAQEQGYNTINDQQIAQRVAQAELNEFVNALRTVEPDAQLQVQQYLNDYYQTGDIRYLNEAKRYYPSDFLERVAVGKLQMQNNLKAQFEKETREKAQQADAELAQELRTDYSDFIETVKGNESMSKALEMFCNAGFIQSKDDMEVFKGIIDGITASVKDQAIKEYEAQKAIDAEKAKAVIETGNAGLDINSDKVPTLAQISAMSRDEYSKAVDKWGLEALMAAQ